MSSIIPRRSWPGNLAALAIGALLTLSFSPFEWWWLSPLIIAAAFQLLTRHYQGQTVTTLRFYLFAVGMYGTGISWIYVSIHRYGGASELLAGTLVLLFVLAYALHGALHGYVYARWLHTDRISLNLLVFAGLWILQEWVRTWLLTGFPWLFLGYSLLPSPAAGWAPVTGVLGLSLLVLASGLVLWWCSHVLQHRGHFRLQKDWPTLLAVLLVLSLWGSGYLLRQVPFTASTGEVVSVSIVQGNVAQERKWRRDMVEPILSLYRDNTQPELGRDLVVWPEAAVTLFRRQAEDRLDRLIRQAGRRGTTIVTGVPDYTGEGAYLNTAVALGAGEGNYIKRRLVPFGEYVPLEQWLRGLITFFDLPMSRNVSGPDQQEALRVGDYKASLSICYEVVYPELVRSTTPDPDFFITISNDTWFGESIGPWQHLQMARMRALENGRFMVRSTNNGITALIDHQGQLVAQLPQFEQGLLRGNIEIRQGRTPFQRLGQWPVLLISLALALLPLLRRIKPAT